MIHGFQDFELDTERVELRKNGVAVAVEPQVFALLRFLIEHRDRMVTAMSSGSTDGAHSRKMVRAGGSSTAFNNAL